MNWYKPFAAALVCTGLFLSSCQKEADETTDEEGCKKTKGYFYDPIGNGGIEDSATYTYTGNKITKVTTSENSYTLEYNGDNIIRRNYANLGSAAIIGYDVITYNSNNQITKVERYDGSGTAAVNWQNIEITYASGKVTKVVISEKSTNTFVTTYDTPYTYTGENITNVAEKEIVNGQATTYNYAFTFDAKENYFKKGASQFLTTEPLFSEFDGSILPIFLSANNAITVSASVFPIALPVSYEVDANANVTSVSVLGRPLLKYNYSCP